MYAPSETAVAKETVAIALKLRRVEGGLGVEEVVRSKICERD